MSITGVTKSIVFYAADWLFYTKAGVLPHRCTHSTLLFTYYHFLRYVCYVCLFDCFDRIQQHILSGIVNLWEKEGYYES